MNSIEISAKLDKLDAECAELDRQIEDLALAAVEGDSDAAKALSKAHARRAQTEQERTDLRNAHAAAKRRQLAAGEAEDAKNRAAHLAEARKAAVAIVDAARRVDEMAAEFGPLLQEIERLERALWSAMSRAGRPPDGPVGQSGLAAMAQEEVGSVQRPPAFRPQRRLTQIALSAWACALAGEEASA
jgi:hypothetical protein